MVKGEFWSGVGLVGREQCNGHVYILILVLIFQISSRHESMLSSHLEMLHSARNAARDDDNMAQIISSMLEKTNRLASQFRVVRKQMVCLCHFFISLFIYFIFYFSSSYANMRTEKW